MKKQSQSLYKLNSSIIIDEFNQYNCLKSVNISAVDSVYISAVNSVYIITETSHYTFLN